MTAGTGDASGQDDCVAAAEAWFLGGPVDGRPMAVETTVGGQLPEVVTLPEIGVYVGSADVPAPTVKHLYVRADGPDRDPRYEYRQSSPGTSG